MRTPILCLLALGCQDPGAGRDLGPEPVPVEETASLDTVDTDTLDTGTAPDPTRDPDPTTILFRSDFESETASCFEFADGDHEVADCPTTPPYTWARIMSNATSADHRVTSLTNVAHSGTHAIEVLYSRLEDKGGAEMTLPIDANHTHVFTRFYEFYADDFRFAVGMKTHRISGRVADPLVFDAILYSRSEDGGDTTSTINFEKNGGANWGGASFDVQRSTWYCVEMELLLNAPGESDGESRFWIDGELQAEATGLDVRGADSTPVTSVFFGGWWSNGSGDPAVPSARYLDDVVVATERIGCD